ncbi:hypothetical protein [Deinococcus cellulosilyticus]|uniref:Uncharacterized protein n=1 Tax=Deinococcus cellulosilyticus (strain DSM 18568 / NBRC 106333 / KACC 11606 / 5516J-15) TaxID=1223518 RepID=A0A511N8E3_DEIC1|nr:hypothetical protein [Deinococcus cellulosilyticus]GEM49112.1 hypothetical protein DC3_47470 [Deinococcus cellulosilyticus NBRC 106333 = KACC 11606]
MKKWLKLSLLSLLLAGCSTQMKTPELPTLPNHSRLLEIQFGGVGTSSITSQILQVGGTASIHKQGMTEASGLSFSYQGAETFTSKDGLTRYIQVHYEVTNTSGQTYHNLGFLPVVVSDTDGDSSNNATTSTIAGTPFKHVKHYDGTTAPDSTAQGLTVTYAKRFNTEANALQNLTTTSTYRSGLDVTGFEVTDPTGLEVTEVKNQGWKFQNSLASGASALMTFSVSFPIPADKKLAPFSFSLMVAYTEGIPDADFYGNDLTVDPTRGNKHPDIVLDSSGAPIVVWDESPHGTHADVLVKRWNGHTWEQLGGVVGFTNWSSYTDPAIAINGADLPVVTYTEGSTTFVKQWNGTSWVQLGGALTTDNQVYWQDVAINSQDQVLVAYEEGRDGFHTYVKQWDGTSWTMLGGSLRVNASGFSTDNAIAIGPDDRPVVAFLELVSGQSYNLYSKQWNGSTWVQLGGALDVTLSNPINELDVAVDGQNRPVVTWVENVVGQSNNVYVKRWTGTAWEQLGAALDVSLTANPDYPTVKINTQDQPVVVFVEDGVIYSKTWNGTGWVQGSTPYSFGTGGADMPAFALDGDTPIVTWVENNKTYVKR